MKATKTLESIVNSAQQVVRISPFGTLCFVQGLLPLGFVYAIISQDIESISIEVRAYGVLALAYGSIATILGSSIYAAAFRFYRKTMRLLSQPMGDTHIRKIIEPNLRQYCNRQGCYAAAVKLGFGEEFQRIKEESKFVREWGWLPGV